MKTLNRNDADRLERIGFHVRRMSDGGPIKIWAPKGMGGNQGELNWLIDYIPRPTPADPDADRIWHGSEIDIPLVGILVMIARERKVSTPHDMAWDILNQAVTTYYSSAGDIWFLEMGSSSPMRDLFEALMKHIEHYPAEPT